MINALLRQQANALLAAAPCSVEMPAGTGKTHLLAAAVLVAWQEGRRSLVLTHTHAGVDAMRQRLRRFGVDSRSYEIDTITGWAFRLARSYSCIGGVKIPDSPDWSKSSIYIEAAERVANSGVPAKVHRTAFNYLFIDEYQDCTVPQHAFVCALASAISKAIVLGDPLQGIFGFADPLTEWKVVTGRFPPHQAECLPHRWIGHNEQLGKWLLGIRPQLVAGNTIDLSGITEYGLRWCPAGSDVVTKTAWSLVGKGESVVVLDKWPATVSSLAARLGGHYVFLEEVQGKFMTKALTNLPGDGSILLAHWLATHAKECFSGLALLDRPLLNRLSNGKRVGDLKRPGIEDLLVALDALIDDPSYVTLCKSAKAFDSCRIARLYRHEGWRDTIGAISSSIRSERSPQEELVVLRERLRRVGRPDHRLVASRTLLVKGLEFDHVVIADGEALSDTRNFYVALTRARKSVTVIGKNSRLRLI